MFALLNMYSYRRGDVVGTWHRRGAHMVQTWCARGEDVRTWLDPRT